MHVSNVNRCPCVTTYLYLSNRITIPVILDTMMSPPTLSTRKLRIWTAGFLFKLLTLEEGTDRFYRNVGKNLPLLAA